MGHISTTRETTSQVYRFLILSTATWVTQLQLQDGELKSSVNARMSPDGTASDSRTVLAPETENEMTGFLPSPKQCREGIS